MVRRDLRFATSRDHRRGTRGLRFLRNSSPPPPWAAPHFVPPGPWYAVVPPPISNGSHHLYRLSAGGTKPEVESLVGATPNLHSNFRSPLVPSAISAAQSSKSSLDTCSSFLAFSFNKSHVGPPLPCLILRQNLHSNSYPHLILLNESVHILPPLNSKSPKGSVAAMGLLST